jgi:hypothetical protein
MSALQLDGEMEQDIFKLCTKCGQTKHSSAFSRDNSKRDGLYARCKECDNKVRLHHIEKNKDQVRAKMAVYRAENREKRNAYKAERRRYVRDATPAWATSADFEDFRTIALMFRIYTGQPYDVDHIVPLRGKVLGKLAVCGLHCDANMTVVPGSENKRKANRLWPDMP